MNNQVNLTDDELSVIQTALHLMIVSQERYVQINGSDSLDTLTKETFKDMKTLYDRFEKEYF